MSASLPTSSDPDPLLTADDFRRIDRQHRDRPFHRRSIADDFAGLFNDQPWMIYRTVRHDRAQHAALVHFHHAVDIDLIDSPKPLATAIGPKITGQPASTIGSI